MCSELCQLHYFCRESKSKWETGPANGFSGVGYFFKCISSLIWFTERPHKYWCQHCTVGCARVITNKQKQRMLPLTIPQGPENLTHEKNVYYNNYLIKYKACDAVFCLLEPLIVSLSSVNKKMCRDLIFSPSSLSSFILTY